MDLLTKMATYVRVVESGSLTAAAKQLRISSAAVSRQLTALEGELKAALMTRSTRKLTITVAGRRYYERCLRILREIDDAQRLAGQHEVDGPLTISAPVTFGLACVVPEMHSLMRRYPGLVIDLRLEDRLVDIAPEGVDVAIRVGSDPPSSTELVAQPLVTHRRALVAAPAYVKAHGEPKRPEALAKHDALVGAGSDSWVLRRDDEEVRVRPRVAFRCNALFALRELAIAGSGVALLPEWFVAPALAERQLRVILPAWQSLPVTAHAIYRRDQRGAARVRALVEHLRAAYASWDRPEARAEKRVSRKP